MRLDHALTAYGQWRAANFSAATWRGEASGLRQFVDWMAGRSIMRVEHIGEVGMDAWWERLDLSDSTKATRLSQVRSFLAYCIQRGWITSDPSALLRAPVVRPQIRDRLNAAELLSLLNVARTPRDRCLLALAMNLGLRGGEIQRLTWGDVHWGDSTIRVRVDKTNDIDDMPMTSDLERELFSWLGGIDPYTPISEQPDWFLIPRQDFNPSDGEVRYTWDKPVGEPYVVVKRALDDIGWDDTHYEGVHTIRRSVARIYFDMVEATESFDSALLGTMTLLHHSRPDTTLTYIGRDRATMARDRILAGKPFLSALTRPRLGLADDGSFVRLGVA